MASSPLACLLQSFLSETAMEERESKLLDFARQFLLQSAEEREAGAYFESSDPHGVLGLLAQQLLTRFRRDLADRRSPSPSMEQALWDFLKQEAVLMLLATVRHISMQQQLDSSHPDLVKLLLTVLEWLTHESQLAMADQELFLWPKPVFLYTIRSFNTKHKKTSLFWTHNNGLLTLPIQVPTTRSPVVSDTALQWVSSELAGGKDLSSTVTESRLLVLLLSVVEGLTCQSPPKNSSQVYSSLSTIDMLRNLLDSLLACWTQIRTHTGRNHVSAQCGPSSFLCVVLLGRLIMRMWLVMMQHVICTSLVSTQTDLLLPCPITTVSEGLASLPFDSVFHNGNHFLHCELSFWLLESFFVSVAAINLYSINPHTPAESSLTALHSCLSESIQQKLVSIFNHLKHVSSSISPWGKVLPDLHCLLAQTTRELIETSNCIHRCQLEAKSLSKWPEPDLSTVTTGFDQMEQQLCKMAKNQLNIFDSIPTIQLLSLQLLAQTGMDGVSIINDFLPRIVHRSVWSTPEVLDLYLELLEKSWFQLPTDYRDAPDFWEKVGNYSFPLMEGGQQVVLQVMYHLLLLFIHPSTDLKHALSQHVILKFHTKVLNSFQQNFVTDLNSEEPALISKDVVHLNREELHIIHLYLKLLQKMASHHCSLQPFLQDSHNLYWVFMFLPSKEFRTEALNFFEVVLQTLCVPWEASWASSEKLSMTPAHLHLVNSLLRVACEFHEHKVVQCCLKLADAGPATSHLGLQDVSEVHMTIQAMLENSSISTLLHPSFVRDLSLVTDVWESLTSVTTNNEALLPIIQRNQVWDIIQVLSLSLASLLKRLYQETKRMSIANRDKEEEVERLLSFNPFVVSRLQETCVSLLCHLLSLSTILCRINEDPKKVLHFHCSELHSLLLGSKLCNIPNASSYIATLMKTACYYTSSPEGSRTTFDLEGPRQESACATAEVPSNAENGESGILARKRSTIRPVSLPLGVHVSASPLRRSSIIGASPSFYPLLVSSDSLVDGESDNSGYDGDLEGGMEMVDGDEEERAAGVGGNLLSPLTIIPIPDSIKKPLWFETPIWQCLELITECLGDKDIASQCERCVELFLVYLLGLVKADQSNLALLASKGLLGKLFDSFGLLFDFSSEKSKDCWLVLCQITEVLATFQTSQQDMQKMFLKLQQSKAHLEQLMTILRKVAEATHSLHQPSAFIQFSYHRQVSQLDIGEMLVLPNPQPAGLEPCTVSMWLCVNKYPLKGTQHIISFFSGEVYVQVWICVLSGDIIINLSGELQLSCQETTTARSTVITIGSIISLGVWHHVYLTLGSVHGRVPQYEVLMVVDGTEVFQYKVALPSIRASSVEKWCYVAGGSVSSHTLERHIKLMGADKAKLTWMLGSLNIFQGFHDASMANLLCQLSPECTPSSMPELINSLLTLNYLETSKANVVEQGPSLPLDDTVKTLQWPYLSYTPHQCHQVFLLKTQKIEDEESSFEQQTRMLGYYESQELQWVSSLSAVLRPQLLDVLQSCTGLEQLVYLFAKTVSEGCSEQTQCSALSVIRMASEHSPYARHEFENMNGIKLIQQVLRSSKACVSREMVGILLDWCCSNGRLEVMEPPKILEHLLLDWRIWHKAPDGVWQSLLMDLESLLSCGNSYYENNLQLFNKCGAIVKILRTSKERSLDHLGPLEGTVAKMFVRLVELLLGSPPRLDCLKYVCDHLLLPDVNEVKLVRGSTANPMEETIGIMEVNSQLAREKASSPLDSTSLAGDAVSFGGNATVDGFLNITDGGETVEELDPEESSFPETPVFDVRSHDGRLPSSSYTADETLFTWTDITGLPAMSEGGNSDDVPVNLETGLLSVVRKIINLLPDSHVRKVIGPILDQESIVVMANNPSILIRTAVVRVLDAFFQRAGESSQANFLVVKGFNLLALQLKRYAFSFELMSALVSILMGKTVNLQNDPGGSVLHFQKVMSRFHFNAVIPIMICVVNTVSQPALCHATLCILRELFESVKGLPMFMVGNGLIKTLCQLISMVPESPVIPSKEGRELILNDLLGFCKLMVLYTISSEQEDIFHILEKFIACLKYCAAEIRKANFTAPMPGPLTTVYVEELISLILGESLNFFLLGDGGRVTPSLESCQQLASQSELALRFPAICTLAVDWLAYGTEVLTADHASLFTTGVTLPRTIFFDRRAQAITMTTRYAFFLLRYFYNSLLPIVKKNLPNYELQTQKLFINAKSSLSEVFPRLLGYLLSPIHSTLMRLAVLRDLWSLEESKPIFNLLFSTSLKKLLCGRIVLTVVDVLSDKEITKDSMTLELCNSLFDQIIHIQATRLRHPTHLSSLLHYHEETDPKAKQKMEFIMDELKNADQRWMERMENGRKDFDFRLSVHYKKLIEGSVRRDEAVNSASSKVTDKVFRRQIDLKKMILVQIQLAGAEERDTLHCWRRVIISNTHPRALWSSDEKRPMCWQLDPTEGPSRVRRRLLRAPHTIDRSFLLPEALSNQQYSIDSSPLSFLFESAAYNSHEEMFKTIVRQEGERIIGNYPQPCFSISPDNCCKGNLIITTHCCYFVGDEPIGDPNITKALPFDKEAHLLSWQHMQVVEIHRRRYMLKDNALEIFLLNGMTFLLAFDNTQTRERVHSALLQLNMPNLSDVRDTSIATKLKGITTSWQMGEITNFEYLMELNKLAGRTFNDLMQYPVFPFILSDYTSLELDLNHETSFRKLERPISIQDESKIQKYKDTYKYLKAENASRGSATQAVSNLSSKPYHYGSHYSNSGIVLHFLVRIPPFTGMFLDFQGKSFDIADRSFHKMATTWWLSSSESATDVKELIPEFYYFPEFLINSERFNFGMKQNGEMVDDVALPPWAKGDPRLFIFKHRQALESDYVSCHLHNWIDLVFGHKQTGRAAVQALNVFHPATYYGADGIDIDAIEDRTQQDAMRTMVKTYGQMPQQLFKDPHIPRSKTTVLTAFRIRIESALKRVTSLGQLNQPLRKSNPYISRYLQQLKSRSSGNSEFIGYSELPGHIAPSKLSTRFCPERIVTLGNSELVVTELNTCFFPSTSASHSSLLVTWGHWDNALVVRSLLAGVDAPVCLYHPPLNRITCCQCVSNGQMLVSAGKSGVVSFWELSNTPQELLYTGKVVHLRGHSGPINCLVACKPYSIIVSGSADGTCIIWDTNRLCYVNSLDCKGSPVTCIATSPTLGDIVTVCPNTSQRRPEVGKAALHYQPCVLKMWTVNGHFVKKKNLDVQVLSLCYTSAPEGVYINVIIGGMANGTIRLWSSWDLCLLCEIPSPFPDPTPVLSLAVSPCFRELYAGYSNMQVFTWVKPPSDAADENSTNDYVLIDP